VDLFIEYERPQGVSYIQVLMNNQEARFVTRLHRGWNRGIAKSRSQS